MVRLKRWMICLSHVELQGWSWLASGQTAKLFHQVPSFNFTLKKQPTTKTTTPLSVAERNIKVFSYVINQKVQSFPQNGPLSHRVWNDGNHDGSLDKFWDFSRS